MQPWNWPWCLSSWCSLWMLWWRICRQWMSRSHGLCLLCLVRIFFFFFFLFHAESIYPSFLPFLLDHSPPLHQFSCSTILVQTETRRAPSLQATRSRISANRCAPSSRWRGATYIGQTRVWAFHLINIVHEWLIIEWFFRCWWLGERRWIIVVHRSNGNSVEYNNNCNKCDERPHFDHRRLDHLHLCSHSCGHRF